MKINNSFSSFKSGYVYVSSENHGEKIKGIVKNYNNDYEQPAVNITDKVNYFIPAAGSGSRLKNLTDLIGDCNKVSFPFPLNKKENLYMLDFPLSLGNGLIDKEGYKVYNRPVAGNFACVVEHYKNHPEDKRAAVVTGADAVFDLTSEQLVDFTESNIKDGTHIALIGAKKTPEESAHNFGVFIVGEEDENGQFCLKDFVEKPAVEIAKKYIDDEGKNLVNTGMVFFSRDAIQKVLDKINSDTEEYGTCDAFSRNKKEKYNMSSAMSYLFDNYENLFGEKLQDSVKIKPVENWEDIGIVSAYFKFLNDLGQNKYLMNFPENKVDLIRNSVASRVGEIDNKQYVILNRSKTIDNLSQNDLDNCAHLENINIIV